MQIHINTIPTIGQFSNCPLIFDSIGDIVYRPTGESIHGNVIAELEVLVCATDNRHTCVNTFVATNH